MRWQRACHNPLLASAPRLSSLSLTPHSLQCRRLISVWYESPLEVSNNTPRHDTPRSSPRAVEAANCRGTALTASYRGRESSARPTRRGPTTTGRTRCAVGPARLRRRASSTPAGTAAAQPRAPTTRKHRPRTAAQSALSCTSRLGRRLVRGHAPAQPSNRCGEAERSAHVGASGDRGACDAEQASVHLPALAEPAVIQSFLGER